MPSKGLSVALRPAGRRRDPSLVDTPTPELTWVVDAPAGDWLQASAEVRLDGAHLADVRGTKSVKVAWPFAPLRSHSAHTVEVRVTGRDGSSSDWSAPLAVGAGFLEPGEWVAPFVALARPSRPAQPVLLRGEFAVDRPVARARLYAAAHGVYQVQLNGVDVDDAVLKPGWTSYQYRLLHESTDVTGLLRAGANAIGVRLAGGWYTEQYGFLGPTHRFYGEQPDFAAQLMIDFADGGRTVLTTGPDWVAYGDGPIVASGIYDGEEVDARKAAEGWSSAEFNDSAWSEVVQVDCPVVPQAAPAEPIRRTEELPVKEVITSPSGATILDFGQNLVGWLRVQVAGPAGHTVTVRHAEVLEHGELGTRPLLGAAATDRFTLAGVGTETFEPHFTYHGFRYAQVDHWPGALDPTAITAVVIHSDLRRTGWFDCSNDLVNRLHDNVVWSMRGNFVSLPTDCPQRAERLGWTGDIQIFCPTASYLYDCDAFLASWLRDLAHEQAALGGVVPVTVPAVLPFGARPVAAWGDAATVVPGVLHERFADERVLAEQYGSMRGWVDTLLAIAGARLLWEGRFQFGDWCDPTAPPDRPWQARVDADVVSTAYLYRSVALLARAARQLAHAADAERYDASAAAVRSAFLEAYVTPAGRMVSDAPTAYALALCFDIATDPALRRALADRLAHLVRASAFHMGTGFVGTPLILDALVVGGHPHVAERLLLQTESPSWLYAVTMGATTIWERWDSMLEDGSINPGRMTSFNHYAFGAVADWLHRELGGLAPLAPGYARLRVRPLVLDAFDFARASHETPYGLASVSWRRDADDVVVAATVPANTTAEVGLPDGRAPFSVGSGTHEWRLAAPRERRPAQPPLTLDSAMSEVAERPEAYRAVIDALKGLSPDRERAFRATARWEPQRTVADALVLMPSPIVRAVGEALARATGTPTP
jgi:alpha-L-rhamnosidase